MHWWKQFKPSSCSTSLRATTKDEVLAEVVTNLTKSGVLDSALEEAALKALIERETVASTGVGMGVAIPHVRIAGLEKAVCSLSVHPEGLDWAAVDGEDVKILFTVLRPEGTTEQYNPEEHLEMMRWIAKLSREGDFRRFAEAAGKKSELVDLLKEMSAV